MRKGEAIKNRTIRLFIWNVLFPILLGGLFYYFFCPDVLFVMRLNKWFATRYYDSTPFLANNFVLFIRNYFLDYVWAYSLCCSICILNIEGGFALLKGIIVTGVLGAVLEILQLVGIAKGTYDVWDILIEIIGAFTGALIINKFRRKQHEKD